MSGIDPLLAMSARVAAAEAAMLEAAINLGVPAEVLQAQIGTGDILSAKILPPQNGYDLIEILGQRVPAQLPPGVHPGETLLLQVTGFAGTQVYVRNLGAPDPRNPLPVVDVVLKAPETESAAQVQTQVQQGQPPPQPAQSAPVSPPRAVFVAASVRQAPPAPIETPVQSQASAPSASPVPGVEARIAAAQAARVPPLASKAAPAAPEKSAIPPLIPSKSAAVQSASVQSAVHSAVRSASSAAARAAQTVSDFLRAARLPDTPFTRMAATIAPHAAERLPSVLQRLEAALPRAGSDPRIPTLRTLVAFTSRLNPANAETLRAQISSYVSNVVEGAEAKLGQLLRAHAQTQSSAVPRGELKAPANGDAPPSSPTTARASVAERSAAISHDLKSIVLSLLRDPPAERTPAMAQALSEALITLTGAQVNALSSNQQNPGTFNLALPVYYHEGGKPAQIRISRDADSRAAKMDADNFHVAFVLDTANLGTIAIDLQTTGRTVKVDVKTENSSAAKRFSDTLGSLRTRLEDLRYRVASTVAAAIPAPRAPKVEPPASGLDLRA